MSHKLRKMSYFENKYAEIKLKCFVQEYFFVLARGKKQKIWETQRDCNYVNPAYLSIVFN